MANFDWDDGNRVKCTRHGLSTEDIEAMFRGSPRVAPDLKHSAREQRFIAVGQAADGRRMFVAFTLRGPGLVRPVSARPMHEKEWRRYAEACPVPLE